ncbi:MAG: hypothetical protein AB7H77_06860 [Bdellovibrionales bacterium]
MIKDIDYAAFQKKLNEGRHDDPMSEEEATAALRNLGELVWLLYKINEREKIVAMEDLTDIGSINDSHNP